MTIVILDALLRVCLHGRFFEQTNYEHCACVLVLSRGISDNETGRTKGTKGFQLCDSFNIITQDLTRWRLPERFSQRTAKRPPLEEFKLRPLFVNLREALSECSMDR